MALGRMFRGIIGQAVLTWLDRNRAILACPTTFENGLTQHAELCCPCCQMFHDAEKVMYNFGGRYDEVSVLAYYSAITTMSNTLIKASTATKGQRKCV